MTVDNAGQPAAAAETPAPAEIKPIEGVVTPHAARLAVIIAARQEKFERELEGNNAIVNDSPGADDGAGDAPLPITDPVITQSANGGNPGTGTPPAPAGDAGTRLVVNGRELVASQDELVRLAQMGASSQERFQEAARMREEAQRILGFAQGQQQTQQSQQPAPAPQNAPSARKSAVEDSKLKDIDARMNYGSEEDRLAALRELVDTAASANGGANNPTPQQIAAYATQQAYAQIRFEDNLQKIGSEFPEVYNDRLMTIAAADRVQSLRNHYAQQGIPKDDLTLYRESCTFVRDRYLKPQQESGHDTANQPAPSVQAATSPASSVVSMTDKLERKRAAPQSPAAATRIASDQSRPSSPNASQIVEQMRKARGQPV